MGWIDLTPWAELHWAKIRIDQTLRRIFIKHGVAPDPLERAVWHPKAIECPDCGHQWSVTP